MIGTSGAVRGALHQTNSIKDLVNTFGPLLN